MSNEELPLINKDSPEGKKILAAIEPELAKARFNLEQINTDERDSDVCRGTINALLILKEDLFGPEVPDEILTETRAVPTALPGGVY